MFGSLREATFSYSTAPVALAWLLTWFFSLLPSPSPPVRHRAKVASRKRIVTTTAVELQDLARVMSVEARLRQEARIPRLHWRP